MAWWRKQSAQTPAWNLEDYHTVFIATIKEQIEQGVAPWQQSWKSGARRLPEHLVGGNAYRGVKALQLSVTQTAKGYRDNRWATATQVQALGGQVRPGEQATPVLFNTVDDELQAQQPPSAPDRIRTCGLRLRRLRTSVQARRPMGPHDHRRSRRRDRAPEGDRGGGDPLPDGAGGLARLHAWGRLSLTPSVELGLRHRRRRGRNPAPPARKLAGELIASVSATGLAVELRVQTLPVH